MGNGDDSQAQHTGMVPGDTDMEVPPTPQPDLHGDHEESDSSDQMSVDITYRGKPYDFECARDASMAGLLESISSCFGMDVEKMKLIITPKPAGLDSTLLRYDLDLGPQQNNRFAAVLRKPVAEVVTAGTKISLLGSTTKEVNDLNAAVASQKRLKLSGGTGTTKTVKAEKYRDWRKVQEEATYTFHSIRPLPYLPNSERSTRFLERLRDDPGIKAAMRAHKFSVPLLTEMNPAEHTTHESRTLGLNRNKGEVIELRLRTDAYDGYRDYKVIRKTLCHELAHCVWGDHDRNFWDLTNQIEKEVDRADWKHGGHKLSNNEFYNPEDSGEVGEHMDHGGWSGGEFVLGRTEDSAKSNEGLSRRDILAQAAMSRIEKQKKAGSSASQEPNTPDQQSSGSRS